MDPVLERVRAANPAAADDFVGAADFAALSRSLAPPPPRRIRRHRWFSVPVVAAAIAALVVLPASAPQASEVLSRAVQAVAVDDGAILHAHSEYSYGDVRGSREVWVQGDVAMRSIDGDGGEEAFRRGAGTVRRSPGGAVTSHPETVLVPTEIFRVRGLLERARDVGLSEQGDAYVLRWRERSGPPHGPTIEMTLWVDKETYAPLRFTDHSWGTAADGKPFDQTYSEQIVEFERLPDTAENRKLLELGG
jgi:hypothetical protein